MDRDLIEKRLVLAEALIIEIKMVIGNKKFSNYPGTKLDMIHQKLWEHDFLIENLDNAINYRKNFNTPSDIE